MRLNDVTPQQWDEINKPKHYNDSGVEAIEYIKQRLADNFSSYCYGNVMKYLHRHPYKNNPLSDLKKARFYLNKMIEEIES